MVAHDAAKAVEMIANGLAKSPRKLLILSLAWSGGTSRGFGGVSVTFGLLRKKPKNAGAEYPTIPLRRQVEQR